MNLIKGTMLKLMIPVFCIYFGACTSAQIPVSINNPKETDEILTGAQQTDKWISKLQGKRIGLVVNATSTIGYTHLVDTMKSLNLNVKYIFAPEHGFRGDADAGEHVLNEKDPKTDLPIYSLYGNRKAPEDSILRELDIVVFDIQDVGCRFYTYLSTLHYVMGACAKAAVPLLVLDRPNPNGHYVDGPIMKPEFKSFVGVDPVPIVHGMTLAEMAGMINGEYWLGKGIQCDLKIISCQAYNHSTKYIPPISPSPNLKSLRAILLYPSLCLTEGTVLSVGRGTDTPFEVVGYPDSKIGDYYFMPLKTRGNKAPLYLDNECRGFSYQQLDIDSLRTNPGIDLSSIIEFYKQAPSNFFLANGFFDKLAGTDSIRKLIMEGKSSWEIRQTWQEELIEFKYKRRKYLLYPE